jgi:OmpA-OmpF porin, OOP family
MLLLVVGAAVALPTLSGAWADDVDDEAVLDPLADPEAERPTSTEIAERVDRLEPRVDRLEPRVDRLEIAEPRSLREEVEEDERTTVSLSTDVLFAFDSAELGELARNAVIEVADGLTDVPGTIEVVGHTDSVGADDYNQQLSEQRAEAVAEVLRAELGTDADLQVEGRGSSEPVAEETDEDPEGAARNRRVEISYDR